MSPRREIPFEADPSGENARWQAALSALRAIADDETETPQRRERARQALRGTLGGGRPDPLAAPPPGGGNRSGGAFLATLATEQGWKDR